MNKTELIEIVATKTGLTKKDTSMALDSILETIIETLSEANNVALTGFGTFSTSKRAARSGVNPSTGTKIQIAESTVAQFKAGSKLKKAVK